MAPIGPPRNCRINTEAQYDPTAQSDDPAREQHAPDGATRRPPEVQRRAATHPDPHNCRPTSKHPCPKSLAKDAEQRQALLVVGGREKPQHSRSFHVAPEARVRATLIACLYQMLTSDTSYEYVEVSSLPTIIRPRFIRNEHTVPRGWLILGAVVMSWLATIFLATAVVRALGF